MGLCALHGHEPTCTGMLTPWQCPQVGLLLLGGSGMLCGAGAPWESYCGVVVLGVVLGLEDNEQAFCKGRLDGE